MTFKSIIISSFLVVMSIFANAQSGYKIDIKLNNYNNDTLLLGYYLGDKQFVKDTAISHNGTFTFKGVKDLDPGVYMAVMLPEKNVFQFIVDKNNRFFGIEADASRLTSKLKAKNSDENTIFFNYIHYLTSQRPMAESYRTKMREAKDSTTYKLYSSKVDEIDQQVFNTQDEFIKKNPKSFTATLIKSSKEPPLPIYGPNDDMEDKIKGYNHFKDHYLDNLNFQDERLFRSPVYFQKIDNFIQNITYQQPDSIIKSLDFVLEKTQVIPDAFKFYLSHYFNFYLKSKFVGMDAVYVHLIDKYYSKGMAPWVDKENLQKMKDAANDARPTLVGKLAPNLTFINQKDSSDIKLYDVVSPYTVMFFWAPDCSHCEKAIPHVLEFYEKYKDKGVEIFAVCTGLLDEAKDCWKSVEKKNMKHFVNVYDPVLLSNFKVIYNIKSTPQFLILDKDKKILSKGIGADQLDEVMGKIIEYNHNKLN
jgi:thiol-disulfide isomerase/thioredoxin